MRALDAAKRRSAAMTSGRRRNTSSGLSLIGTLGTGGDVARNLQLPSGSPRLDPEQDVQSVHLRLQVDTQRLQ